jgi:hypothetical protein
MPIDMGSTIKKASQWAFGSPILHGIMSNNLLIAGLISLVMILIIMIMYPAKKNTKSNVLVKMFFYMFISSVFILFLHDSVIKNSFEERDTDGITDELHTFNNYNIINKPIVPERQQRVLPKPQSEEIDYGTGILGGFKSSPNQPNIYV